MFKSFHYPRNLGVAKPGGSLSSVGYKRNITEGPASLGGLIGWWQAELITPVASGSIINTVPSYLGVGGNMTQNGADNLKPRYVPTDQNGLPSIAFAGGQVLNVVPPAEFTNGFTFLIVGHWSGSGGNAGIISGMNGTSANDYNSTNGLSIGVGWGGGPPSGINMVAKSQSTTNISTPYTTFNVWTAIVRNINGTTCTLQVRKNGTNLESSTKTMSPNILFDRLIVGARYSGGNPSSPYLVGRLSEIVLYNYGVTEAQISPVETFLRNKYGI